MMFLEGENWGTTCGASPASNGISVRCFFPFERWETRLRPIPKEDCSQDLSPAAPCFRHCPSALMRRWLQVSGLGFLFLLPDLFPETGLDILAKQLVCPQVSWAPHPRRTLIVSST